MINIVLISLFWVLVIDCTDLPDHIKEWVSAFLTKGKIKTSNYDLKPFTCSLCMTWWTSLIYVLIAEGFNFPLIIFGLALAVFTPVMAAIIHLAKGFCIELLDEIATHFNL